jgi:hypothetical protein
MSGLEIAEYGTAGATFILAVATWRLARKTSEVANVAEKELLQGNELLKEANRQANSAEESARAARFQADLTSKIVLASNQPFLTLTPNVSVLIRDAGDSYTVQIALSNFGAGVALFDKSLRPPTLKFNLNGFHDVVGSAERVVVLKESYVHLNFEAEKAKSVKTVPTVEEGGLLPPAVLEFWFTDANKFNQYKTQIDLVPNAFKHNDASYVAEMTLSDIRFEGPILTAAGNLNATFTAGMGSGPITVVKN